MPARYFSVEEVNELLPELEPLMAELLARRAKVIRTRQEITPFIDNLRVSSGSRAATEMAQDFAVIERLIKRIRSYGCVLKDMNVGLLDFLSERNGREVYLCWRYGEPRVAYYHELHSGFSDRQRIE